MAATVTASDAAKQSQPPVSRDFWKWFLPIGLGILLRLIPPPTGLSPLAWHYFALFAAIVVALITSPLPEPAIGFIGITLATLCTFVGKTPADATKWMLSGFANDTVWLIFAANIFAVGYEVTGLGRRIALMLVKALGKRTLGLGYAVGLSDLILAPFMPSNTARSGGTIFPVVRNIPPIYGSLPDKDPRKIGSYVMWVGFAIGGVTSSMFLTGLAPNLLALEICKKIANVEISWTTWFLGFLPVGVVLFILTPLIAYYLYPPEIKRADEVVRWASDELKNLGRLSRNEILMALFAAAALIGWLAGGRWITPATVAFTVISLMLLTKVVVWNQIVLYKQAWSSWVFLATLLIMASALNTVGFLKWFADRTASSLTHISPTAMIIALVVVFFFVHYLFASLTAHTTAVLPVFLAAILTLKGIPVKAVILMLVYSLGLMGVLTPYATGPGPIWYGAGYIPAKDFWRMGAIMGLVYLIALLGIGLPFILKFIH